MTTPAKKEANQASPATEPRGPGAPTKDTPETRDRILQAIRLGATYELAAGAGGITYDTLNEWRKDKPDFSDALKQAEGEGAVILLAQIQRASKSGYWQAAAWILERRHPHSYGRTVQEVEHSAKDGKPIVIREVTVTLHDRPMDASE